MDGLIDLQNMDMLTDIWINSIWNPFKEFKYKTPFDRFGCLSTETQIYQFNKLYNVLFARTWLYFCSVVFVVDIFLSKMVKFLSKKVIYFWSKIVIFLAENSCIFGQKSYIFGRKW